MSLFRKLSVGKTHRDVPDSGGLPLPSDLPVHQRCVKDAEKGQALFPRKDEQHVRQGGVSKRHDPYSGRSWNSDVEIAVSTGLTTMCIVSLVDVGKKLEAIPPSDYFVSNRLKH